MCQFSFSCSNNTYTIHINGLNEFYPKSKSGNHYALTAICMLTGYTFCIPLKSKTATEIVQAYIDKIYAEFGGLTHICSDKGREFKNSSLAKQSSV